MAGRYDRYGRDGQGQGDPRSSSHDPGRRSEKAAPSGRHGASSAQHTSYGSSGQGKRQADGQHRGQDAGGYPHTSGYPRTASPSSRSGRRYDHPGVSSHGDAPYGRQAGTSQYARGNYGSRGGNGGNGRGGRPAGNPRRLDPKVFIALGIVMAFIIGIVVYFNTRPFDIVVNGRTAQVAYGTTYADLHDEGLLTASNGDLIAVDKSVLQAGGGGSYKVYDNDQQVSDLRSKVKKSSVIVDADGDATMEDYDEVDSTVPFTTVVDGGEKYSFYDGVLTMMVYPGRDGLTKSITGKTSGKTAVADDSVTMVPRTYWSLTPHIDSEKVVCLTFDDGPGEYTQKIMDVLAKYKATATFFEIGLNIDSYASVTTAVAQAGYEVGSHAYAHPGVVYDKYFTDMTDAELVADLKHNQDLIANATGQTCTVLRPPGGYLDYANLIAGANYITAAARWSSDTEDWSTPGTSTIISNALANVYSGSIILMHDGGGDRSETVAALDTICSKLQADGYRFVTVAELAQLEIQKLKAGGMLDADGIPVNTTATATSSDTVKS